MKWSRRLKRARIVWELLGSPLLAALIALLGLVGTAQLLVDWEVIPPVLDGPPRIAPLVLYLMSVAVLLNQTAKAVLANHDDYAEKRTRLMDAADLLLTIRSRPLIFEAPGPGDSGDDHLFTLPRVQVRNRSNSTGVELTFRLQVYLEAYGYVSVPGWEKTLPARTLELPGYEARRAFGKKFDSPEVQLGPDQSVELIRLGFMLAKPEVYRGFTGRARLEISDAVSGRSRTKEIEVGAPVEWIVNTTVPQLEG